MKYAKNCKGDEAMTTREAKQKAIEWWGDAGVLTRLVVVFGLIGSVWLGLTAAKNTVEVWLVPQHQYGRDLDSLTAFIHRRELAELRWMVADSVFKKEMRDWKYQDCVRRAKTTRACIEPK